MTPRMPLLGRSDEALQTYCVAGLRGLELANIIFGKPLKYWPNSLWFQRTLWDLRPFAHELQLNSVEMTSTGSSSLSPASAPCRVRRYKEGSAGSIKLGQRAGRLFDSKHHRDARRSFHAAVVSITRSRSRAGLIRPRRSSSVARSAFTGQLK